MSPISLGLLRPSGARFRGRNAHLERLPGRRAEMRQNEKQLPSPAHARPSPAAMSPAPSGSKDSHMARLLGSGASGEPRFVAAPHPSSRQLFS